MEKPNYTKKWQWQRFREGQRYPYVIDSVTGKKHKRIKYGNEHHMYELPKYCPDCGVTKGYYHWMGCDIEENPIPAERGEQLLTSERVKEFSK